MSRALRQISIATVVLLATPARGQPEPTGDDVRVLLLRPSSGAEPAGFGELVGTLRLMVGRGVTLEVAGASIPAAPDRRALVTWGTSVARSEGASGVIWLEPGAPQGRSVMWVVRVDDGEETAERFELEEPRAFDRMRALALAARPLLDPLIERARERASTETTEEPALEPATDPAEVDASATESEGSEREGERATEGNEEDGAVNPGGGPGTPPGREPATPRLRPRLALGATVRNGGVIGARLAGELAFRESGWAAVSGELLRTETRADGSERQRAQAMAFVGVGLAFGRVRLDFGGGLGVAMAWPDAQEMVSGFVVAATGGLSIELAPELTLTIPLTLEGVLARPEGGAIPGWQGSVGLLLGIAP